MWPHRNSTQTNFSKKWLTWKEVGNDNREVFADHSGKSCLVCAAHIWKGDLLTVGAGTHFIKGFMTS